MQLKNKIKILHFYFNVCKKLSRVQYNDSIIVDRQFHTYKTYLKIAVHKIHFNFV